MPGVSTFGDVAKHASRYEIANFLKNAFNNFIYFFLFYIFLFVTDGLAPIFFAELVP